MQRLCCSLVLVASLVLSGCAGSLAPREVVLLAADAEGEPVLVTVEMMVAAVGMDNGWLYINAEADYRDQRNISLDVPPASQAALRERFGLAEGLIGRRIAVHGWARRQTIVFNDGGRPTGLYYFQTHLFVSDPDQLRLLD